MNSLAQHLKKLRDQGLSYEKIAWECNLSSWAAWNILNRSGLLERCKPVKWDEINFQTRASTALALIRAGRNSYRELAAGLGYRSVSSVEPLIAGLLALDLVEEDAGKYRTLRLTELGRQSIPLIQLTTRRPDGVLEAY